MAALTVCSDRLAPPPPIENLGRVTAERAAAPNASRNTALPATKASPLASGLLVPRRITT